MGSGDFHRHRRLSGGIALVGVLLNAALIPGHVVSQALSGAGLPAFEWPAAGNGLDLHDRVAEDARRLLTAPYRRFPAELARRAHSAGGYRGHRGGPSARRSERVEPRSRSGPGTDCHSSGRQRSLFISLREAQTQ
jgi:hypothetical protein